MCPGEEGPFCQTSEPPYVTVVVFIYIIISVQYVLFILRLLLYGTGKLAVTVIVM